MIKSILFMLGAIWALVEWAAYIAAFISVWCSIALSKNNAGV